MMTKLFVRWLPCVTLATWSAILLYFFFSKRVDALLHPTFRPYVLAAGVLLGVMAGIFLLFPADASCCSSAECGHSLSRRNAGKLLTFLVLLLPITVATLVSPDSFGRTMIENRRIDTDGSSLPGRPRAGVTQPAAALLPSKGNAPAPAVAAVPVKAPNGEPLPDYIQRTPEGHIVVEVLDLLYAAQDSALRKDFEGRTVELVGQLMPDKTSREGGGKRFKAVRMFMTCCAADARPVATLVEAETLPELPEMTWVKIVGTSTFPLEKGRRTAVLKADRVEKTAPPEEMMLY
jgi:uncharacterized repeat protein (TIGR03943 family)